MNIASVDLNLLLAFEAILEERSVTRAARGLGLSQPAMSNTLGRLRALFGDQLFIRTRHDMTPTVRALQIAEPVRNGLAHLRNAFGEPPLFDPASSMRSFRLAMTDYAELVLLGAVIGRIQRTAPHMQILVRRPGRIFIPPEEDLATGTLDMAVGFFPDQSALDPGTHSHELFVEDNVCIGRKGHPLMGKRFALRQFAAASHVGIFYRADTRGLIDNILATHGFRRRLQAATPDFLNVPYIVAQSDLIAVVPAGLAARYRRIVPLDVREVPIQLPRLSMRLLWHARADADAAHQWLRSEILECSRKLAFTK